VITVIFEYQRAVEYRWGRYARTLQPGVYWTWPIFQRYVRVDTRQASLQVTGQQVLTADRIAVGFNLLVWHRVADPALALNEVASWADALHQAAQLAAREAISARDLEAVLGERPEMAAEITEATREAAQAFGVEVIRATVKDVMVDREVEAAHRQKLIADQRGQAELVAARHEVAAARARANAARIVADHPAILAQRRLDVLEKAAQSGMNQFIVVPQELAGRLDLTVGR